MSNKTAVRENSPEGTRTINSRTDWEELGHELLMALLWERSNAVEEAATTVEQGLQDEDLNPEDVQRFRSAARRLYIFIDSDLVRATPGIDHYPKGLGQ
jgi:hypothetical protein